MPNSEIAGLTEDTTPDPTDNVYAQDAAGAVDKRVPLSALPVSTATTAAIAAEAALARNADNLTSGTVADARVAATIARDSEVTAAVAAEATLARNGDNITSGTVADARIASTIARDSEVTSAVSAAVSDTAYAGTWNAVTTIAPSKNAVYDEIELRAPKASPTFTGTPTVPGYLPLVAAGAAVENLGAVESNVSTVGATGSTETLDTSIYAVFDMTMDQACTFTFSNPAPSGKASVFVLILRGAFTPTWPGSVDWSSATPPTYTTPSVYTFTTIDAGTTWLGAQVGKAFA